MHRQVIKFYITICLAIFVLIFSLFLLAWQRVQGIPMNNQVTTQIEAPADFNLEKKVVASGVVPHHLAAQSIIADFFTKVYNKNKFETIILLSPDHFESANLQSTNELLSLDATTQDFFNIPVDRELISVLQTEKILRPANSALILDHGITNLLPFIKHSLPKIKIVPILVPQKSNQKGMETFINLLKQQEENILLVASTDFSHYLPRLAADLHDVKSQRTLLNFEQDEFSRLEVDCWQCLYGVRYFAQLNRLNNQLVLAHKNSQDFLPASAPESTTSYLSVLFSQIKRLSNPVKPNLQTFLFVGDIMLDRGVEELMAKNSLYYPWENMTRFLNGVDIVFANLEGPIVKNPPISTDDSLTFAFSEHILPVLKFNNINLVSLANNHTQNMKKTGLEQTRQFLKDQQINFVGDPVKCNGETTYTNNETVVLAFNQTFYYCSDEEMAKTVVATRLKNPKKFIIVSMHWGVEYQPVNSVGQQKLGQKIIEAGADLIIGNHPHVVQNIELYRNKLIFYSLGNFIFDQYFSLNTQQGLAVGLELNPDNLVFRLFPVQSKTSQPFLLNQPEAGDFLTDLANKSSKELQDQIKSGIIEVKR